jgi:hypothetical protein
MRMKLQTLIPRMQDAEEADLRAQMTWVSDEDSNRKELPKPMLHPDFVVLLPRNYLLETTSETLDYPHSSHSEFGGVFPHSIHTFLA